MFSIPAKVGKGTQLVCSVLNDNKALNMWRQLAISASNWNSLFLASIHLLIFPERESNICPILIGQEVNIYMISKIDRPNFHEHNEVVTRAKASLYKGLAGKEVAVTNIEGEYVNPESGKSYPLREGEVQVRISGNSQAVKQFWNRVNTPAIKRAWDRLTRRG